MSGTSPACGSTHACRKSKHKHILCTLYQAQAQPAVMCTLYQAQAKTVVAHMRVGKASTSTPCACCIRHKPSLRRHTCVLEKASTSTPYAHCIRHKPSLRYHTCVSDKQAQAHLVHIVSGTSPACGSTHVCRKQAQAHFVRVVSGTSRACDSTHACRKSKHKHTLCTLYQAQAQPAVAHMRVGKASTSTPCACCIRHNPGLR